MEVRLENLEELSREAARFARGLAPIPPLATLVTLSGDLGAGKTAFIKALARAFGVEETVTSPTFVLEKIYALPQSAKFKRLIHIDAYRLQKVEELSALGFDELMKNSENLVCLEWPERVSPGLPASAATIMIKVLPDNARIFTYG